jgi:DNA-directed RNA polymerase specialized sigma24 family protein
LEDLPVTATAQEATQESVVELDGTLRMLDNLAPRHRKILVMICLKEYSYIRTARELKIPVGTVRSRLSRAAFGASVDDQWETRPAPQQSLAP